MKFLSFVHRFYVGYKTVLPFLLSLCFFFLGHGPAAAQQPANTRFELIHEHGDQEFTAVSLKENGLALIREKQKSEGNQRFWEIVLLDSTLQQTWNTVMGLERGQTLVGYDYTPGELYFLFRQTDSDFNDLFLFRIYLFSHTIQQFKITPKLDFKLTHFIVAGNSAIFGGYVTRQPAVLLYEMASDRLKVIPGFFVDNTELLDLKANGNATFNALLIERGRREKKLLLLKTFDESGSLLLEDDIEVEDDRTILAGTTSTLKHDELLLAGVWGQGAGASKQASGIFSVLVDPFNKQPIHYMDFGELEHFLDYLPPRRVTKMKNKAERRRRANKPPLFRVNVHVVKMEESAKGFALLCEVYAPSVSTNYPYYNNAYNPYNSPLYNPYYYGGYSPYAYNPMMMNRYYNSPYSPYGNPRNSDVTILNSSLIMFDRLGKRKEDFGFKLNDVKLPSLEQVSDFYASQKFVQFYKKERDVFLAFNWEDGNPAEEDTVKIALKSELDVVRNESDDQGGIRYWFGPYGYAWGYETIKNKVEQSADPVRYVYYINKVRLD